MTMMDVRPTNSEDAFSNTRGNEDSETTTNGCYLPWCEECWPASAIGLEANDVGHAHTGATKIIETTSFSSGGVDGTGSTIRDTVSVAVHRFDDDIPGQPVTGETQIWISIGGGDGVYMTPPQAEEIVAAITTRVRIAGSCLDLLNPNEVDAAAFAEAQLRWDERRAAWEAERARKEAQEPEATANEAERRADLKLSWYIRVVAAAGKAVGRSRLSRWFPRLADFVAFGRIRVELVHWFRLGVHLGVIEDRHARGQISSASLAVLAEAANNSDNRRGD